MASCFREGVTEMLFHLTFRFRSLSPLILVLGMGIVATPAFAANKAVIIGPTYPGGLPFDDTIAQTRANQIAASIKKWGNWDAGNVGSLTGGVTCAQITGAITAAAAGMVADDIFLLIYHGHGSYDSDLETVGPALDTCDESIWPSAHCFDDAVTTALGTLPATVRKFVVLASCYSGGFWNGTDPPGDLENLTKIGLLAAVSECECLTEPSTFVDNLLARTDPAGWPGKGTVTFQEFIDAVMAGAAGSAFNSNRWADPLPKCPCSVPDPIGSTSDFDYNPEFKFAGSFDPDTVIFVNPLIPALSPGGVLVFGVLLSGAMYFALRRRRGRS